MIAPFFPKEGENKETSPLMIGIIIGISPLTIVILSPCFGYLLPRVGVVLPSFVGLFLVGTAYILMGFVNLLSSAWAFVVLSILLRIVEGVGTALFFTTTLTVFPILFPDHIGTLMGVFQLAVGLGFSLGYLLGGALYKAGGFKLPFIFTGTSILLVSLVCTPLIRTIKIIEDKTVSLPSRVIFSLSSDLIIIALILALIIITVGYAFYTPVLQLFLVDNFDYNSMMIAIVFACTPVFYTISTFIVGPVVDKLGYNRCFNLVGLLVGGSSSIAMGTLYALQIMTPYILIAYLVIYGVFAAFTTVPVYGDILQYVSKNYMRKEDSKEALVSFISGLIVACFNIGESVGTILGGMLNMYFSFPLSEIVLGELILAEMLLLWGVTVIRHVTTWSSQIVNSSEEN